MLTTNCLGVLLVALIGLCGCEKPNVETTSAELPSAPQRIVSLAPNITEILFALGQGDHVVGVTRFCDYPEAAKTRPKVGGLIDPDIEAILALRPDMVLGVTSSGDPAITRSLNAADVSYKFLRMESLDETLSGIQEIGALVGARRQGIELADDMRESLDGFKDLPLERRPSVLVVFGHNPIVAAGPSTFPDDLVARAGGRNILSDFDQPWPTLDVEKVIQLNPDRILDVSMVEEGDAFWKEIPNLNAVKTENVYRFTDPAMMRPGPRLVDAYRRLAMAIHGKHHVH